KRTTTSATHGFLWAGPAGWRLSPAYDLNPVPTDIEPRGLYFELAGEEARAIARDVGNAVASYCKEASRLGLGNAEIEQEADLVARVVLAARQSLGLPHLVARQHYPAQCWFHALS